MNNDDVCRERSYSLTCWRHTRRGSGIEVYQGKLMVLERIQPKLLHSRLVAVPSAHLVTSLFMCIYTVMFWVYCSQCCYLWHCHIRQTWDNTDIFCTRIVKLWCFITWFVTVQKLCFASFARFLRETLGYHVSTMEQKFMINQRCISAIILSGVSVILSEGMKWCSWLVDYWLSKLHK